MNILKRYILFFLAVACFYAGYSYILDIAFCFIDFGSACNYRYWLSFIMYGITILFFHFMIFIPLALFYNASINQIFSKKDIRILRYLIGLLFGICIGYAIKLELGEFGVQPLHILIKKVIGLVELFILHKIFRCASDEGIHIFSCNLFLLYGQVAHEA